MRLTALLEEHSGGLRALESCELHVGREERAAALGSENRSKLVVKAQGGRLRLTGRHPLDLPASVRLQSTTGQCWESAFDVDGVIANGDDRFKGLGD